MALENFITVLRFTFTKLDWRGLEKQYHQNEIACVIHLFYFYLVTYLFISVHVF